MFDLAAFFCLLGLIRWFRMDGDLQAESVHHFEDGFKAGLKAWPSWLAKVCDKFGVFVQQLQ